MRRKDIRKRKGIRYAEYYNMVEIQDELYRQGMMKKKFYHLMPIIASPQNIRLAYRNLKNNKGSNTPGVDGKTFADYAKLEDVELIRKVQEKLLNYQPKAVRRVYIPKSNGKLRPLGIPTVLDRLVQQSILQVLEPVCESKFHRYSYGFRPNRSCKQAVAMCYKLAQVNGYHYVVDVDIKGFFDHVNHGKLLKQLWSLGIRDKSLLCVISRMLKAPVEENGKRTIPQEGTPQGGVLSPLLANIVLNELDWWIHSQWAGIPIHNPSPSEIWRTGPDGMLYRPGGNTKLQRCNLKHVYIVRYADDFKVFCRNYNAAKRLKIAVERWLLERLHLETSPEKSKITNLEESYSEFLGIKFKLILKGQKWAIKSHMTDKAIKNQQKALKSLMVQACHDYGNPSVQHIFVNRYNQAVVGIHEYYSMATMVNEDILHNIQTGESTKPNLQERLEQTQQEFDRLLEMSLDFDEDTPFLDDRLKKLNNKIKSLKKAIEDSAARQEKVSRPEMLLSAKDLQIQEYDDALTARIIEKITVRSRNEIEIRLIGGYEKAMLLL